VAESNVRYVWDAEYSDGPSPALGSSSATIPPSLLSIAATPAPTQPCGRLDPASGTYSGVVVVVSVVDVAVLAVVVVSVVVVVVSPPPSAHADAAAKPATSKTMPISDTPRRI
jgi:hypothetical protein